MEELNQQLKPMCVINLVIIYRERVSPEYAVARAHHLDRCDLELFNEIVAMGINTWLDHLIYTPKTVVMGDWATILPDNYRPLASKNRNRNSDRNTQAA